MSPGLRLSLLALWLTGCAPQMLVVPDSDWQTVPAAQRARVDREQDAELAAARAELAAASAGLAELQRAPVGQASAPRPTVTASDPDDDEWVMAVHRFEQASAFAYTQVELARTASQRADRSWRQLRYEAAEAQIEMVVFGRELARARAIDHTLLGTDSYDSAPLRGQFSVAQKRWYTAANAAREARSALERASATLTTAKEAYAQLMRVGPMLASAAQATQPAIEADAPAPRLLLTGWSVTRSDIRRRRGLRHYLDEAAKAPSRLRAVAVRLPSPAARPAAAKSAAPTGSTRSSESTAQAAADTNSKPAGAPGAAVTPSGSTTQVNASTISKPAGTTSGAVMPSRSTGQAKNGTISKQTGAATSPAGASESTAQAADATSGKQPATPTAASTPSGSTTQATSATPSKPVRVPTPAARSSGSTMQATSATSSKPAAAPPVIAKPVEPQAKPAPAASRKAPAPGAASVAKPVEAPVPQNGGGGR